jgi:para-aminobenzoate synthetase/4-amino-4-deoxychorismate lyase
MAFTVRLGSGSGWISFENPSALLCAATPQEVEQALAAAGRAVDAGSYVAGYLAYPGGSPLAVIGVFEAPRPWVPPDEDFAVSPLLRTIDAHDYAARISEIHDAIYNGDVYQVNYTVPFSLAIEGDIESAFSRIARSTKAPYQGMVTYDDATILSWSPELFLQFDGDTLTTRPMKGTSTPGNEHELLSEKNRGEHIMIVDLLRNDLQRVCSDVRVTDVCAIERYPTYSTVTSTIRGTLLPRASLSDIFRAAFPCGSITGAPKRAAIAHIERSESRPREAYCGAIGYLGPGRIGWWNVAIRTAQLQDGIGRFDVGGGIVIDSNADEEWQEIGTKSLFLLQHAAPVSLLETFAADAPRSAIDLHLARLRSSAERLSISYNEIALREDVLSRTQPETLLRLRLHRDGAYDIRAEPLETPEHVRICLGGTVRSDDPWLAIKSTWRPAHDRAATTAREHGCFDAILRNERGELTEGARTNLFIERDGVLLTPPLGSGLLPGVLRTHLLTNGRAREHLLYEDDLVRADDVYVGNSSRGLLRAQLVQ